MIKLAKSSVAALMLGLASFAGLSAVAVQTMPATAGSTDTDVSHNDYLKIGFDDPLPASRNVLLGLNKTMIVEVPRDLRDVVVSNPEYVDAVVQSSNRVYLIAKQLGNANVFFFDENGEQILSIDVRIERDMAQFDRLIERLIPGANIKSEVINDTIILTGSVPNPADSNRASDIAARFMTRPGDASKRDADKVVNMLVVEAKEQVMLKVSVAEVQREAIKRLGVNWNGVHAGDSAWNFQTNNTMPITNANGNNTFLFGITGPSSDLSSCLPTFPLPGAIATGGANCLARSVEMFERNGLLKTLAEPTLTAISGETASFLAGGEFPVPVAQDKDSISVEWKPFGVGLSFTPLVLSEGRISLKIATEVSEISSEGAVTLTTVSLPGLKVRRANTTVELPSGGSLVIAGLISDDTRANIDGVPGIKNLPILGTLFRSRDFQKQETELLVIVTPYVVNPVHISKINKPTDGLIPASDARATFLGQLNKVYGKDEALPSGDYEGNYGFIVE
ncbi:MAG: type II and III secretion system protein family protein [Hyphomicrobiaceae bacterium]